ncbi:AMP-binding protein [Halpernia sp. GG3]
MNLLTENLYRSFHNFKDSICLQIDEQIFTYSEIFDITKQIRAQLKNYESQNIGIYLTSDSFMYASILAIWFEGRTYVPIHVDFPFNKNDSIIEQAGVGVLLSSIPVIEDFGIIILDSTKNVYCSDEEPVKCDINTNAYILFTSGSTGNPKGVPISFKNLIYFVESYENTFGKIFPSDKVLQMFELTFDVSVVSYLVPWLSGATVVGLNKKEAKFLQILDLLEANKITVAQMVPSILTLTVPYLDPNIVNKSLRTMFFAGEALLEIQMATWRKFVPNSKIYNAYGPTENTIVCIAYELENEPKVRNGIISIGKPMLHNEVRFLDNTINEGEMLLSGQLLTAHYWKNTEKDSKTFINVDGKRFYKTGDWCERDAEGNIFYKSRVDYQVKINGFRVELAEVEYFANKILKNGLSVAISYQDKNTNDQLVLFTNDMSTNNLHIINYLKNNLPEYMVPSKIFKIEKFPVNLSGKIDRKELKTICSEN